MDQGYESDAKNDWKDQQGRMPSQNFSCGTSPPAHARPPRALCGASTRDAEQGRSPAAFSTRSFLQVAQEDQQRAFGKVFAQVQIYLRI